MPTPGADVQFPFLQWGVHSVRQAFTESHMLPLRYVHAFDGLWRLGHGANRQQAKMGAYLRPRTEAAAQRHRRDWRPVGVIVLTVYRASVRDKVFYILDFCAIGVMGASYLIRQLTTGQDVKIIKDL